VKEKLNQIDASCYKIKPDNKWSILEHVGHLADLEPLWQGRLDDILSGKEELRPTDLQNTKTTEANHNSKQVVQLLNEFSSLRRITVDKLKNLKEEAVFLFALHPRLKTPMRTIDLFTFVAEHDDHHLAKITELSRDIIR
ncbi:MAG: DinB family protein, partial [Marivirga sp.]|nr:DinB family protein [Marivirga sp.]